MGTLIVHQASADQSVDWLLVRHFVRVGKVKKDGHFAGEPCGDCAGRVGLHVKRQASVKEVAVRRNGRFNVAAASTSLQEFGQEEGPRNGVG